MFPIVQPSQFDQWEQYAINYQSWLAEDLKYTHPGVSPGTLTAETYRLVRTSSLGQSSFLAPLWQVAPTPTNWSMFEIDIASNPQVRAMMNSVLESRHARISGMVEDDELMALYSLAEDVSAPDQPISYAIQAIFDEITDDAPAVGFLLTMQSWDRFLRNIASSLTKPMIAVIEGKSGCNVEFSYRIEGPNATFLGYGNLGDDKYARRGLVDQVPFLNRTWSTPDKSMCRYFVSVYPTTEFETYHKTSQPIIYTCIILACFICVLCMFIIYDVMISRRHNFLYGTTMRTNDFVTSLFPEAVHRKMLQEAYAEAKTGGVTSNGNTKSMLKEFTAKDGEAVTQDMFKSKPLADLFPNCTSK